MTPGLPIVTAAQMRAAEQAADASGTSYAQLMQRAGTALARATLRLAGGRPVHILAGPGNNGGDGYVAARWLEAQGVAVRVSALAPPATALALEAASAWGGSTGQIDGAASGGAVLVDCLFGTGLNRSLDESVASHLVRHADAASRIIAADLPSGVASDSGALLGCPFRADVTIAFGALKPAHLLMPAAGHAGEIVLADIGLSISSTTTVAQMPSIAPPDATSHKYNRGLVTVVAGRMAGAAELAARAAQRSGTGYVRLIGSSLPPSPQFSLVRQGWRDGEALTDPRIGAVVIGCGLGSDDQAQERWAAARSSGKPLVIDADALAFIGDVPMAVPAILTPHSGEFDRMTGGSTGSKIDRTRVLAERTRATVIHKGADTVIAAPDGRVAIAPTGSPWLASAGTGDVLAGICGAMLARGLAPFEAAQAAVLLHHRAAATVGPGLIADDLVKTGLWP